MSSQSTSSTSKSSAKAVIQWIPSVVNSLFHLILINGAHLQPGSSKGKDVWLKVHEEFYAQPEHRQFMHCKVDEVGVPKLRILKDKFVKVYKSCISKKSEGNLSGLSGEHTTLFKYVEQIKLEIEEKDDEDEERKLKEKSQKEALNSTEAEVITRALGKRNIAEAKKDKGKAPVIKNLNGELIADIDRLTKKGKFGPGKSFENSLLEYMAKDDNLKGCIEEDTEKLMLAWVFKNNKTIFDLFEESFDGKRNPQPDALEMLESFGDIDVLVSIYCTRGCNFDAKTFKSALDDANLQKIVGHILYAGMQKWRVKACAPSPVVVSEISTNVVSAATPGSAATPVVYNSEFGTSEIDDEDEDVDMRMVNDITLI